MFVIKIASYNWFNQFAQTPNQADILSRDQEICTNF